MKIEPVAGPGFEGFKAGLVDLFHQTLALLKCRGIGISIQTSQPSTVWIRTYADLTLSMYGGFFIFCLISPLIWIFFKLTSTYPEYVLIGCLGDAPDSKLGF